MKLLYSILLLTSLFCFVACEPDETSTETSGTGKIVLYNNYWLLYTDTQLEFQPTNLADEFKVDQLKVRFKGFIEKDFLEDVGMPRIKKIKLTFIEKIS